MITVVLVIHVFIVLALVGVVLLQRSEGGALGMGGGGAGNFMSGRGAANVLTRTTTVLAALFFATSLGLAVFGEKPVDTGAIERELTGQEAPVATDNDGEISSDDLLDVFNDIDTPATSEDGEGDLLTIPDAPAEDEAPADEAPADEQTPQ